MPISQKDKNSLIVLAVFFIGVAYYIFLFDPIYQKGELKRKHLSDIKKNHQKMRKLMRESRSWFDDFDKQSLKLATFLKRKTISDKGSPVYKIVEDVNRITNMNNVILNTIRPITVSAEDGSESIGGLSLGLSGSYLDLIGVIDGFYGLAIDELNFSSAGEKESSKFNLFLRVHFLEVAPELTKKDIKLEDRKIVLGDLFQHKQDEMEEEQRQALVDNTTEKVVPVKVVKTFSLNRYKLVGIYTVGLKVTAILTSLGGADDLFISKGDKLQNLMVQSVSKNKVVFKDELLKLHELVLPENELEVDNQIKKQVSFKHKIKRSSKNKKLGLGVKNYINKKETLLPYEYGLKITKVSRDCDLTVGDIILTINEVPTKNIRSLKRLIKVLPAKDALRVRYWHGNEIHTTLLFFLED